MKSKFIIKLATLLFLLGINVNFCGTEATKEDMSLKALNLNHYHFFLNQLPKDLLCMTEFFNDRTLNACSVLDKNHSFLLQKFLKERKMYNEAKVNFINGLFCSELGEKVVINFHDIEKIGNYSGRPKEINPSSFKLYDDGIRVYFFPVLREKSQLHALYITAFLKKGITTTEMQQIQGIVDTQYREFAKNIILLVYPLHTGSGDDQSFVGSVFTSMSPYMGKRIRGVKIGYDVFRGLKIGYKESNKKLAIKKPGLPKFESQFLKKCANLTVLNLSDTRLDQFPNLIECSNLFEVDFSGTNLEGDIPYECFPYLHKVKVNLERTRTKLPEGEEVPKNLEITISKDQSLPQGDQPKTKVSRTLIFQ